MRFSPTGSEEQQDDHMGMDTELSEMDLLQSAVQSTKPLTGQSKRHEEVEYALTKVRSLMALVRLSESQDQTHYPLGLAEVLSHYPRPVIDRVCSVAGIPSESEWMPSIKQVKEACEKELRHFDLMNRPKVNFRTPERHIPRVTPNLWVPEDNKRYEEMCEKAKHPSAVACEMTRFEERADYEGVIKKGIWIPLGWWEDRSVGMKPIGSFAGALKQEPAIVEQDDDDFTF